MLNLAKQSDAIGSPLSQPDRRVHKKVHLNTTTRARAISRSRAGALRADVGVAKNAPFAAAAFRSPHWMSSRLVHFTKLRTEPVQKEAPQTELSCAANSPDAESRTSVEIPWLHFYRSMDSCFCLYQIVDGHYGDSPSHGGPTGSTRKRRRRRPGLGPSSAARVFENDARSGPSGLP